jgi:chromosome segregation and condensation protein ScpB
MGIKGKLEAVIYAAEEPVTLDQLMLLLKDSIASEGGLNVEGAEPAAVQSEVKSRLRASRHGNSRRRRWLSHGDQARAS